MTSLRKLALMISAKYRKKILDGNIIYKAIPNAQDPHMRVLHTIWTTFVDPDGDHDLECSFCLNDILNNFRGLQPELVALAKEEILLESL